ncbi:MAG: CorA family divalent cation transporter [Pseudomonadota bacterium]
MMRLFSNADARLEELPEGSSLTDAVWIDICDPSDADRAAVAALGTTLPSFDEMRQIEVSSRLFRAGRVDHMTVFLLGPTAPKSGVERVFPVTFVLSSERLVTIRYHSPRPFETYPAHAATSAAGCGSATRVMLGLLEEVVGRQADRMEEIGDSLDGLLASVLEDQPDRRPKKLSGVMRTLGIQGEKLTRLHLGLVSLERLLSFYRRVHVSEEAELVDIAAGVQHDIKALIELSEFVSDRISFATDLILGLISVDQNTTMRIFSIITGLFMPPTLIASMYGMNFSGMPELDSPWGYPVTLCVMAGSSILAYLIFKWRRWI